MANEVTTVKEEDLHKVYPNTNIELRAIALTAFESGSNVGQAQSAGLSIGIIEDDRNRVIQYVDRIDSMLDAAKKRPIPDLPVTFPARFDIDLRPVYMQHTKTGQPINQDTQYLTALFLALSVEIAASNSAGMAGSMIEYDWKRAKGLTKVIREYITEVGKRPIPDFANTPEAGAPLTATVSPSGTATA